MEAFFLCLLSLLILIISLFILFWSHAKRNNNATHPRLPPGTTGWPILGESLKFARSGPENFIQQRVQRYSEEVFKTSLLGEKMVVFCGAAAHKFLFTNENNLLTTWWPASFLKPLTFPTSSDASLKHKSSESRNQIEEILRPKALKQYVHVMDSMAREQLETDWVPFGEVKVHPQSKKYTFSLACRLFMGVEDPGLVKTLSEFFNIAISGMLSVPIDLPGTGYNRAVKGGKLVKDELLKIITERKKELLENGKLEGGNFLTTFLLQAIESGYAINEMVIANRIVSLLTASYDATSTGMTFLFNYLAELPDIYSKVYEEIMEIAKSKVPGELLNWNDIQKMKYSWNVACEALRLVPPTQGVFREAITDFTYAGFTIQKGWKTFWSAYSTHKNPKYFSDPTKFDPSRFDGKGPAPYTFVPFGGGPRMCPGREYTRLQMLVFMYNVVIRFKLEKLSPDEKIIYHLSPAPQDGLPIRLLPHKGI